MIDYLILDYDTFPEQLTYNNLIRYKGKKKFSNVKSIEAKVNTEDLTLSFLGPLFPNLEKLKLNNSVISSIRDIGCSFPKLRFLSLAQCNITSLDGIGTISSNLQELYLAGNKVPDLIDLIGMDKLRIIDLEDNGISSFSTVEILNFCDRLSSLTLKGNPIAVDPAYRSKIFQIFPKLTYLDEKKWKEEPVAKQQIKAADTTSQKEAQKSQAQVSPQAKQQNAQPKTANSANQTNQVKQPLQTKQTPQNNQKAETTKQATSPQVKQNIQNSKKAETSQTTSPQIKQTPQNNQKVETSKQATSPQIKQTPQNNKKTETSQTTSPQTKQTIQNNQKAEASKQATSNQAKQTPQNNKKTETSQTTSPQIKQTPQNNQKVETSKQATKQTTQNNQKAEVSKQATSPQNKQTTQNNQKVGQPSQAAPNAKPAPSQARKRPPSADNVKRAMKASQESAAPKKVEMPNTPPPRQPRQTATHSPRKVAVPATPDDSNRQTAPVAKLTDRKQRHSASRFNRPNTKLTVSKLETAKPPKLETAAQKPETAKPPKSEPLSPKLPEGPKQPLSPASPRARQAGNRAKNDEQKKSFNRTAGIPKKRAAGPNEAEIMTDMVQDLVNQNIAESDQNKSCLYERSAFPEFNDLSVRRTPSRNGKAPEIIRPLSARGPVYI